MSSAEIIHDFLDPPEDGAADHLGTIGHYKVIRQLGKGGMGYVFLAEDMRLKREVALKVMNQKIAATPGSRKRFISEARSMAAVHHDNVATIFEVGEYKGTPYMAMELLEGATLENMAERRPDYGEVIRYARDMARGLAAAHAQGIVHRDIKPANIWLDSKTDRIKILDFGLALASTPVDQLSGRGSVVGTPGYLSPEQARSEPLDDRSDLYSTGVVLYEMACGRLPLKTKSVAEQLIAILAHEPTPLREQNDAIPQPLADLIHQLMAKEPRDRIQSAAKLEDVLDKVEVECESKSEVAQAINQLQAGLNQVVKKKESPKPKAIPKPTPAPNPFDALPNSIPAAPLAADPLASVQTPPSGTFGAPVKKPAPKKETSPMAMWIAIGVIAVGVLVVLPIAVFWGTSNSIDRQQELGQVSVDRNLAAANGQASASTSGSQNQARQGNQQQPRNNARPNQNNQPNQNKQGSPSAGGLSLLSDPPAIKRNAQKPKQFNAPGVKWVIGAKQANGSFENTRPAKDTAQIPGWTIRRTGPDAGWRIVPNPLQDLGVVAAYIGEKSEAQLLSNPIQYRAKANDVFRIGANVGGEQKGTTDYRVVLGFEANDGTRTRYELATVAEPFVWGIGKQARRLRYMYKATPQDAGKRPFVEFTMSNKKRARKGRTFLDRVVLTVAPAGAPAATASANTNLSPAVASPTAGDRLGSQPRGMSTPNANNRFGDNRLNTGNRNANNNNSRPSGPASVRQARISTKDQRGADTGVKRGSGREILGEQPRIAVQTRSGKPLQHMYLRFNLDLARGNGNNSGNGQRPGMSFGGNRGKRLAVDDATLRLTLSGNNRPAAATLQVYGLGDQRSDVWPENRLVWSNSLSAAGLNELPLVAEITLGQGDPTEPQVVSISSPQLAAFIASIDQSTFTLVIAGKNRDEPLYFVAKEESRQEPPTVTLMIRE